MFDATKPYRVRNNIIKKLETNNNEAVATGFLEVSVFEDESDMPISDAEVSIYRFSIRGINATQGEEVLIVTHTTDESGKVPIIELPVLHEPNNINNEIDFEHLQYHMNVNAFGYYPVTVINIEIFTDTTTLYRINMSPITTRVPRSEFIIIPEKHQI
ncbi:MAG: hypothetical protein AB7V16_10960 [Vulcanibacillus sp.]